MHFPVDSAGTRIQKKHNITTYIKSSNDKEKTEFNEIRKPCKYDLNNWANPKQVESEPRSAQLNSNMIKGPTTAVMWQLLYNKKKYCSVMIIKLQLHI